MTDLRIAARLNWRSMNRLAKFIGLLVICLFAFGTTSVYLVYQWSDSGVNISKPALLEFTRGTSLADLSWQLESQGIVDSSLLFQIWVRLEGAYPKFQAGNYEFNGAFSPSDVSKKIINGETFEPVVLRFTIPEGFTN